MKVSVIIPVYNAARFVSQAVRSALEQPETGEVILIEDGSPDNSLDICKNLAEELPNVRLLRHKFGRNRGAGASRNLGMRNARFDYIAFLDADDYYLPGRFKVAAEVFEVNPECEGVYEAIGIHFEDKQSEQLWQQSAMAKIQKTTMTKRIPPEDLFETFISGKSGYFSIIGLVIKRSVLDKVGYMNESLKLHQDTDFILRLSAVGQLIPGSLEEPVTIRRVHGNNRITMSRSDARIYKNRMKMWVASYRWLVRNNYKEKEQFVFNVMMTYCTQSKPLNNYVVKRIPVWLQKKIKLFLWLFEVPDVAKESLFWKNLLPITIWKFFYRKKT